jgi:hypothetical protein
MFCTELQSLFTNQDIAEFQRSVVSLDRTEMETPQIIYTIHCMLCGEMHSLEIPSSVCFFAPESSRSNGWEERLANWLEEGPGWMPRTILLRVA